MGRMIIVCSKKRSQKRTSKICKSGDHPDFVALVCSSSILTPACQKSTTWLCLKVTRLLVLVDRHDQPGPILPAAYSGSYILALSFLSTFVGLRTE
jgi:hypothetical protein